MSFDKILHVESFIFHFFSFLLMNLIFKVLIKVFISIDFRLDIIFFNFSCFYSDWRSESRFIYAENRGQSIVFLNYSFDVIVSNKRMQIWHTFLDFFILVAFFCWFYQVSLQHYQFTFGFFQVLCLISHLIIN